MTDVADALTAIGCPSMVLDLEEKGVYLAQTPDTIERAARSVIADVSSFRPDFILSYGTGGIIGTGSSSHMWEDLGIPYVLLFFDAPLGQELFFRQWGSSRLLTVGCWDRHYRVWFEEQGVKQWFYLPLGTNAQVAGPVIDRQDDSRLSFVGSLDARYVALDLPCSGDLCRIRDRFLELKVNHPCVSFDSLLARSVGDESSKETFRGFASTDGYSRFAGDLMRKADAVYRRDAIKKAASVLPVRVFGNSGWEQHLPSSVAFAGTVNYGSDLAQVYCSSAINLNLTNSHLQTAVNQRVFDCPAAGGFILSDYREDAERFFEPGVEIVCFKTMDEMSGLLERYKQSPLERQRIAMAARRRVLSEHTWDCRMRTLTGYLESGAA